MTYRTWIILHHPQLKIDWQYKKFPRWLFRVIFQQKKYEVWWQHEICRAYRILKKEPSAFSKSFAGLPKLNDRVR